MAVAGKSHRITGTAMVIAAYATSLLLIERLFKLLKPKLLTLPWLHRLWSWFATLRGRWVGWLIPSWAGAPADSGVER